MENEITSDAVETEVVESAPVEATTEPVVESAPVESTESNEVSAEEKAFDKIFDEPQVKAEIPQLDKAVENKGLDHSKKGPNSWKPSAREKFGSLPEDVKAEIMRRESEAATVLQKTTDVRKFADQFDNIITPYTPFLRSLNIHPLQAVQTTLNTAYVLQTGDMSAKAATVAAIIRNNKIDLNAIDEALAGNQPKAQDPVLQELNQLKAQFHQREQAERQQTEQYMYSEIEQFAQDPKNEFFGDVIGDMQVLLANGRAADLQDAYDRAVHMNPEIRNILESRRANTTTTQPIQQNAAAKIAASSSVRGAPVNGRPPAKPKFKDSREATEAAFDAVMGSNFKF